MSISKQSMRQLGIQLVVVDKKCQFAKVSLKICVYMQVQLTQELKLNDHAQRREFIECIINHQQVDADFSNKIIFSDEAQS